MAWDLTRVGLDHLPLSILEIEALAVAFWSRTDILAWTGFQTFAEEAHTFLKPHSVGAHQRSVVHGGSFSSTRWSCCIYHQEEWGLSWYLSILKQLGKGFPLTIHQFTWPGRNKMEENYLLASKNICISRLWFLTRGDCHSPTNTQSKVLQTQRNLEELNSSWYNNM